MAQQYFHWQQFETETETEIERERKKRKKERDRVRERRGKVPSMLYLKHDTMQCII